MQIEREIVLPVPREEAWDALTNEERLEEWFANDVELDPRPGGEGVFEWDNGEVKRAVVEGVEEHERLVLRWDDDGRVELELSDHPDGPRVHVRETSPGWGIALELQASAAWASAPALALSSRRAPTRAAATSSNVSRTSGTRRRRSSPASSR